MPKTTDHTTITLPRKEYDKIVKFKKELEQHEDLSWLTALGIGAFVGFMVGLASTAANRSTMTCICGNKIDLTEWKGEKFRCQFCKKEYLVTGPQPMQ